MQRPSRGISRSWVLPSAKRSGSRHMCRSRSAARPTATVALRKSGFATPQAPTPMSARAASASNPYAKAGSATRRCSNTPIAKRAGAAPGGTVHDDQLPAHSALRGRGHPRPHGGTLGNPARAAGPPPGVYRGPVRFDQALDGARRVSDVSAGRRSSGIQPNRPGPQRPPGDHLGRGSGVHRGGPRPVGLARESKQAGIASPGPSSKARPTSPQRRPDKLFVIPNPGSMRWRACP